MLEERSENLSELEAGGSVTVEFADLAVTAGKNSSPPSASRSSTVNWTPTTIVGKRRSLSMSRHEHGAMDHCGGVGDRSRLDGLGDRQPEAGAVGVPLGNDELYDLLHRIENELGLHHVAVADLQKRLLHLEQRSLTSLRRSGVINYDADHDVGGARSRSIALLDDEGSGLVVSVLVSRTDTSFYLKRIAGGVPEEPVSPEEREVINRALQQ